MSLDPFALTTLAAVKDHLNIPTSNTTQDAVLTRMINAATDKIETYLDRKIRTRSFTEHQDGRNSDRILLRNYPAQKPTQLWLDPSSEFTDPQNLIDPADYELEDEIGLYLKNRYFPRGQRNIRIVYTAGFSAVPYAIEEATIWTVEFLYDMRSDRSINLSSKGKNQETTTFSKDLPDIVQGMLEPYRRLDFHYTSVGVQNV